jgi:hypothetical protein
MSTSVIEDVNEHVESDQQPTRSRRTGRLARRAAAIVALVVVFGAVLLVRNIADGGSDGAVQPVSGTVQMPTSPEIEATYGVRFTEVNVTAAGGMIQIRYQVLDSGKAGAIHDEEATPHILDARGTDFSLPGMPGHTHIGPVKAAGTTDFVLLANAGGEVKHGAVVTIKMGKLELHNVPVS